MQSVAGSVDLGLELPPSLSHHEWEELGRTIAVTESSSRWKLADWLNYGEDHFEGEGRYVAGQRITGLEYGSLRNVAYVGDRFPLSRRRDSLSFGHHAEIAAIVDEAAQDTLLDLAESEGLSVKVLREHVRVFKGGKEREDADYVRVTIRLTRELHARLEELAAEDELKVEDWCWRCVEAELSSRTPDLAAA